MLNQNNNWSIQSDLDTPFFILIFRLEAEKMTKSKERVNKTQERALESLDYVMDCRETPDFVEVTGRMGGDVIT